jgi:hypothetical protein
VLEGVHALDPDASRTPSSQSLIAYKTGRGSKPSIPPKRQVTPDALAATTAPDSPAIASAATMANATTGARDAKLPAAPPSRGKGLVVAILAVLVLAGAGIAYVAGRKKDAALNPEVAAGPGSAAPQAAPIDAAPAIAEVIDAAPPVPSTVLVTIEGAPKNTPVMRNGERIGLTPKVELAYGTKEVPLVVQAPGYDAEQVLVTPDADKSVSVKLTRTKTGGRPHTPTQPEEKAEDKLEDPFGTPKRKSGD